MAQNDSIYDLLRRALQTQVEMGYSDIILKKTVKQKAGSLAEPAALMTESKKVVSPGALFTDKSPSQPSSASQYDSIESHRNAICNCQLCPLGKTRNKFVYGAGNPNADVLFIGEAPGADEDRLGEPFVGRAGQLLDKILAAIQLTRNDVYIANILKCRPPNNRDPQPEEMELCFPYLHEQIRLIQPKLICTLGRIAAQAVLQTTTPLGKLRNRWHQFEGVPTLVTYHPAALLRFPSYKRDTWEDMKKLRAQYDALRG